MASAWFVVIILSLGACWMAYLAIRARIWRLGFVFTAGVLCLFACVVPAYLYQFSHDPSLKLVAAACFAGAIALMTLGWAMNSRGSLRGLAALMSLVLAALLVQLLRLIFPASYGGLSYLLQAIAFVVVVAALNYERFFRRANSRTE